MKRLLAAIALLLVGSSPLYAQQYVTRNQLANYDLPGVMRVVNVDPNGVGCTLENPPVSRAYHSGATWVIYTCQSSVWTAVSTGADADAIHDNQAGEIAAITEKVAPVAADLVIIEDSEAGNAKKKAQVGNLPGGGGGDQVSADGASTTDPDLRSEGDVDVILCTGAGAPDAACVADQDVIFRMNANSVDAGDLNFNYATSASEGGAAQSLISAAGDPADAGVVRLGNAETICWERATPGVDICWQIDGSNFATTAAAINSGTGFTVGGAAATGEYLRGTGTYFVSSAIQAGDIPDLSGTYLTAETNDLETDGASGIAADEVPMGTGTNTVVYKAMPSTGTNGCAGAGEALQYNTTTDAWVCLTGLGAGGTVDSIQGDDDVATTGAIISIDGGTDVGTDVVGDTLTITLTTDFEEESQIGTTNVTGNAGAVDQMILGTTTNTAIWINMPSGGTDGCSAAGDKPIYTASTNSWSCGTDGGGSETNTLTTMGGVADFQVPIGASAGVGAYIALAECNADQMTKFTDGAPNTVTCVDIAGLTDADIGDISNLAAGAVDSLGEIGDLCAGTQILQRNSGDTAWECIATPAGGGDVLGPVTSADNTVARFNGTDNKTIQSSAVTIGDEGATTVITVAVTGTDPVLTAGDGTFDFSVPVTATSFTADDPGDGSRGFESIDNTAACADPAAGSTSLCSIGGTWYRRDTGGSSLEMYSSGGTDVPLVDGGTGASDAPTARTNLGLAIGTDVQAWDAELDTLAGLTETNDAVIFAAGGVWTADTTPALDCTDCTNIPATADLNDITNVALTTPGDGAVLCFTGTSNNSVDCAVGGDATATEDGGTLTIAVVDDSHNHIIANVDNLQTTLDGKVDASGDTMTGELVADDLGVEFTPGDTLTDCSTFAATGGGIFYDDSEGKFKKCQDNTLTDLDTVGGGLSLSGVTDNRFLYDNADSLGAVASWQYDGTNVTTDLAYGDRVESSQVVIKAAATAGTCGGDGVCDVGDVVYITGNGTHGSDTCVEVDHADSDSAATMPAIGIVIDSVDTTDCGGTVLVSGELPGVNHVASGSAGDALYVSGTAGTLTVTKPTGTALIQRIATLLEPNAATEDIMVAGALRSNDVPNLTAANFWLGNASGVAQQRNMTGDASMSNTGVVTISTLTGTSLTFGDGGDWTTWTVDAGATDPTFTFSSDSIAITGAATFTNGGNAILDTTSTSAGITTLTGTSLTFGDGGDFTTWTVDAGATDPTFTFASDSVTVTNAATFSLEANSLATSALTTELRSMHWGAGAMSADGTGCANPAEVTIPAAGGVKTYGVICNDGGTIYGSTVLPDGLDATGDVSFELSVTRPSGGTALAGDFSYQCKAHDAAIDNTWATGGAVDITLTTVDDFYTGTIGTIDIDTECDPGDGMWWRYVIDDANHDASAANILGVKMEYYTNIGD